ncbi:AbrB/MazE/SpoVT family DNA-binding domain-containing protein [Deltaproteobacteria bacterium TL4]
MRTQIQKWGNSLALRIPRTFVQETHLSEKSEVEITLERGDHPGTGEYSG